MTAFDEQFHETATPAIKELFGEDVRYYSTRGPKKLRVTIKHAVELRDAQLIAGDDRELIEVTVTRGEGTYPVGGIEEPQRGDKLNRLEKDPKTKVYGYTGKVIRSSARDWTLEFERIKT